MTLAGVEASGAKAPDLNGAFGVAAIDPVNADAVTGGAAALRAAIGRQGFPSAVVGEPEIVVGHATQTATPAIDVRPGGERRFGRITTNADRVFGADHAAEIARFVPGQRYDATALDDLRRASIQTGLVSSVEVAPLPGATLDLVDVAVGLERAPPRTIAGELGHGSGEGARGVELDAPQLYLPEGALTLRSVLGTREQLGAVVLRRAIFHGRDRVLVGQLAAAHTRRDAYDARTFPLTGSLERQTGIFFQKTWTWSVGAELLASDERDVIVATGAPRRRTFPIGALPTSLFYDGSDDLSNPTRGFRLGGRLSPELSLQGAAFGCARAQVDASGYRPVGAVVLAGRVRVGSILERHAIGLRPRGATMRATSRRACCQSCRACATARVSACASFQLRPDPRRCRHAINPRPGVARVAVYVSLGQAF